MNFSRQMFKCVTKGLHTAPLERLRACKAKGLKCLYISDFLNCGATPDTWFTAKSSSGQHFIIYQKIRPPFHVVIIANINYYNTS